MNPTGRFGLWALLGIAVLAVILFIFAPFNWALGISIAVFVAFVVFLFWILSGTRFT